MHAIILNGDVKSALAAVRSLGTQGVPVSVGGPRNSAMAMHSRYASRTFVYPSPYTDRVGFIATIRKEAALCSGKPYIFAFSDATYMTLFEYRHDLADVATLSFPEDESVHIAFDKAATYSLAHVEGVPTIHTYTAERKDEIAALKQTIEFPAVIKPRKSVTWQQGVGIFGSAVFVHTPEQFERVLLDTYTKTGEYPVIQEYIKGEEYGVEMLVSQNGVEAIVTHHRIRSLSPTGGASVVKETMDESDLQHTLIADSLKLVAALRWVGPIMVEWKVDADTREPKLMEINGRFWGSLPLSIAAGVDMPYLYHQILQDKHKSSGEPIRAQGGVITRHFLGDVQHVLRVFFKRDKMRRYTYPRRMKALKDFIAAFRITKGDVFSWRDPKPALMEYIDIVKR